MGIEIGSTRTETKTLADISNTYQYKESLSVKWRVPRGWGQRSRVLALVCLVLGKNTRYQRGYFLEDEAIILSNLLIYIGYWLGHPMDFSERKYCNLLFYIIF